MKMQVGDTDEILAPIMVEAVVYVFLRKTDQGSAYHLIASESPSWTGIANLRGACKKLYHKAGLYGLMRSKP